LHFTNEHMTESYYDRHLALVREAEDRRLARPLRAARSKRNPRSDRRITGFRRAIALWGRTSIPFFKAQDRGPREIREGSAHHER
jgi:hypothetical protein